MKYLLSLILVLTLTMACKRKVLSGKDLENKLIMTMQDYLEKDAKAGTKFKVKDVSYYTDVAVKSYRCEFHVEMRSDRIDTLGTMTATISNDFKKVDRLY